MSSIVKFEKEDPKYQLMKRTIGKDLTNDEFELFAQICRHTGLDPFIKQIYPIKRKSKNKNGDYVEVMNPQVGIDGLRSIAERTGNYTPGKESTFQYDKEGKLFSATSYVKKRTSDGVWHETSATAIYGEYKPSIPSAFWSDKPHIMLAKCAEALAIRRAFPAVTANLYIAEEVGVENVQASEIHTAEVEVDTSHLQVTNEPEMSNADKSSMRALELELMADQIPTARLGEWIKMRCQTKNELPEKIIGACLQKDVLPKFKKSFQKWIGQEPEALAV